MSTDLSLFNLVLNASAVVQFVMGLLLVVSLVSWTMIFAKSAVLGRARRAADKFEQRFWSGTELTGLYNQITARKREASGMENIFEAGFKEFARLRKQPAIQPMAVLEGAQRAMRRALKDAGIEPSGVQYINAHGTSTPANDLNETKAIKAVFGPHAAGVNVSSTKGATGHMLGAAGSVEFILGTLAIEHNVIPPTINYQTPDPECDLDYTPNKPVQRRVDVVLSNSFGFGGHNVCLAIRRFTE